jgi:hypothetical protein
MVFVHGVGFANAVSHPRRYPVTFGMVNPFENPVFDKYW